MTASQLTLPPAAASLTGRRDAIGFVGADVPVEVLLASGRAFGHLPWLVDANTPWADRWLEAGFPGWARSILEQWYTGAFDGLSSVVFSRADDASQRLYYYVSELQRRGQLGGPPPRMFDLALVPRAASLEHSTRSVEAMLAQHDIDVDALGAGVHRANHLRAALRRLQQARGSQGPFHERLGRAALWSDASTWIEAVPAPPGAALPRVLLAGSVPPDDRLHRAVEDGGACVVAEAHVHALGRLGPELELAEEAPARAIARHLVRHATGPRAFLQRGPWIVARAREARAAAVILWLTREDEALAWQLPAQRQALAEAGLRTLVLPAAHWLASDGALDRIHKFCRELRA